MPNGPTVFPALKYKDGHAAVDWLARAFGFHKTAAYAAADGSLAHAELSMDAGIVMLGTITAPDPANPWADAPSGIYVHVKDIEAHFARAKAAGADIVRPLADTEYGSREYTARDPEGHLWSFGTYRPGSQ